MYIYIYIYIHTCEFGAWGPQFGSGCIQSGPLSPEIIWEPGNIRNLQILNSWETGNIGSLDTWWEPWNIASPEIWTLGKLEILDLARSGLHRGWKYGP